MGRCTRTSRKLNKRIPFVVVLLLIVGVVIGAGIRAKYKTTVEVDETVQFEAELAENVTLTEHAIERNKDGSYKLKAEEESDGKNEYEVMPGVDIPKDPTFTITNKSEIPTYLYVEVVKNNDFPNAVTFNLTNDWTVLTGVTGPKGGQVYLYKEVIGKSSATSIPVIKDNKLIISQTYHSIGFELDFYGYMTQTIEGKTAKEVFEICFLSN